ILIDRRLFTSPIGVLAIACAAFNDVTGWLILGAVMALVRATQPDFVLMQLVLFGVYLVSMIFVVRPAIGWLARLRGARFGESADEFALIVLAILLSAAATDSLGIHALFGAFFLGLMMPRDPGIERTLRNRIEPVTLSLFLPLFFAYTG